jgi:hypothetical protein
MLSRPSEEIFKMRCLAVAGLCALTITMSAWPQVRNQLPRFEDYPVSDVFKGAAADPILVTPEQRLYRTRIRQGVSKGRGVWNGSWKDAKERPGVNFAGHYTVIRWGCGSNCLMMAVVDAKTGRVHPPPLSGAGTEFYVPMDPMSESEIDFKPDSRLMILRNACQKARTECGVYAFDWKDDRFRFVQRQLLDLTKNPPF